MPEYISLGPCPLDEEAVQVSGSNDDRRAALAQCDIFESQLVRMHPQRFRSFHIAARPHDLGEYYEVVVEYDPSNQESMEFAQMIKKTLPAKWDEQSLQEIGNCMLILCYRLQRARTSKTS